MSGKIDVDDIMVSTRVSEPMYAKILNRQRKLKELTGIEPSVSAVVRSILERDLKNEARPKKAVSGR